LIPFLRICVELHSGHSMLIYPNSYPHYATPFFEPTQGQIAEFFDESYPQQLSDAARAVLNTLDFVDPEHLASLLPAIALYAAEDGRR
jgi:hypothetical protein